jgi:hypothetical protein
VDRIPDSTTSSLQAERIEVRKLALELVDGFENYKTVENLYLNPIVKELIVRLLQSQGRSREPQAHRR